MAAAEGSRELLGRGRTTNRQVRASASSPRHDGASEDAVAISDDDDDRSRRTRRRPGERTRGARSNTSTLDDLPQLSNPTSIPWEVRRAFQSNTLGSIMTHDSMPDLVAATMPTQGSLPDVSETSELSDNSGPSRRESVEGRSNASDHSLDPDHRADFQTGTSTTMPEERRGRQLNITPEMAARIPSVGSEIRVRSHSAGGRVSAVVTDTDGDSVRVVYQMGSRFCVRTVPKEEYLQAAQDDILEEQAADGGSSGGAGLVAPPPQVPAPAVGATPPASGAGAAPAQVWHSPAPAPQAEPAQARSGGGSIAAPRVTWQVAAPTPQEAAQGGAAQQSQAPAPEAEPQQAPYTSEVSSDGSFMVAQEPARGRQTERAELAIGSTVAVRSSSLGRCVEGVVTDMTNDRVRVQYFMNGRSCTKAISRSSLDMQLP